VDDPADLGATDLFLAVGRTDMPGLLPANRKYHAWLEAHDVPHRYHEYPGGHQWTAWAKVFPLALSHHLTAAPEATAQR